MLQYHKVFSVVLLRGNLSTRAAVGKSFILLLWKILIPSLIGIWALVLRLGCLNSFEANDCMIASSLHLGPLENLVWLFRQKGFIIVLLCVIYWYKKHWLRTFRAFLQKLKRGEQERISPKISNAPTFSAVKNTDNLLLKKEGWKKSQILQFTKLWLHTKCELKAPQLYWRSSNPKV